MTLARLLVLVSLVVLGSTPAALAARPEVRDQAGFFSAEAVQKANRDLEEIRRQSGKELVIETYAKPPAEVSARLAKEPRDRVYAEWADRRATDAGVNGIYVLITRNPAHLQIAVGNETRKAAFTTANRDKLRDLLLNALRQKKYDEGLAEAIDYTRRTLDLNVGSRATTARPAPAPVPVPLPPRERATDGVAGFSWTTILIWGGLIVLVLWVVSRVMRNRAAEANRLGGAPGYGPGAGPGVPGPGMPGYGPSSGGGGGFGRGLLGGLLGGVAGGYLYDRMRGRSEAEAGGHSPAGGGFDQPGGAPDTDFSSSGGDFGGGDAGGGDTGGGDLGGGDFGGGDAGGGSSDQT